MRVIMPKQVEIKVKNQMLHLSGDLDFSNVMPLYRKSLTLFEGEQARITIDFSELTSTNSVALALIISWMNHAVKIGKALKLQNLSQDVMSLAKASGLDKVIQPVCL
jgi:anti-anti-sigma factor